MALSKTTSTPSAQRQAPIPEDFITLVRERSDVLQVVSRSVQLKKSGANHVGLCPFHKEKSPSFSVSTTRNTYHCFGCGAGGDALSFLMEHDGVPFRDAVKTLAMDAGLRLPDALAEGGAGGAPSIETGPLYEAMGTAAKFFTHVLNYSDEAKAYLKQRGLKPQILKRYMIGMSPNEWRGLKEAFPDYETNKAILDAALVREKDPETEGGRRNRYDTFRNRITFAVRDTKGRVIAFGARVLDGTEPKYLNSPETPIFNKSGALFGLYEAREAIRSKGIALVVEGYMDVVMLAQHGVEYAVASMGTACTRAHIERLLTQSDCIAFCFDGDAAGRKAARRALETCIPLVEDRHDIRFMVLPNGQDPDEFVQAEGAQNFEARVRSAPSLSEFLISEISQENNGLKSTEDRARFAANASALAGRLSYRTKLRKLLLDQIAAESKLPGTAIATLRQAAASRQAQTTLWSRIAEAVALAPAEALEQRELLLEVLDTSDLEERNLSEILTALPENAPAGPLAETDARFLLARDLLRGALDLVIEHRKDQARAELSARYDAGEISEQEYMRASLASA